MGEFHRNGAKGPGLPIALDTRVEDDRGWLAVHNVNVLLNGERVTDVIAFNTAKGSLVRLRRGEDGNPVIIKHGRFGTETVKGKVEVQWA